MAKHAFLSASGAPAWSRCEIKPWREKDVPDQTSSYAEEGTRAHAVLEELLILKNTKGGITEFLKQVKPENSEMVNYVLETYNVIYHFGGVSYPEQQLDISFITGEIDATGTADAVVVNDYEIVIVDLKYGMGVPVDAVDNEQLLIYGAAAVKKYDILGDIKTLRMVISQPRLGHASEWVLTLSEVDTKINNLRDKATKILTGKGGEHLVATPGDKQCRFCKVKGSCPEYRTLSLQTVANDFVDLDIEDELAVKVQKAELALAGSDDAHLATCLQSVDMIEQWCVAVRSEVAKRLFNGTFTDPRFKLVQGKRGHRKWVDNTQVADILISKGFTDVYDLKLLSPAKIEKILKDSPEIFEDLQPLITQTEGGPSVAPAEDKRPALTTDITFENIEYVETLLGLSK